MTTFNWNMMTPTKYITQNSRSFNILDTLVPPRIPCAWPWQENILLSCGLFPHQRPWALVYCPCYRLPTDKFDIRALTSHEMLRLYQLLLSMDALLADLHLASPLSYEDSAPPGLFTSVLCQLWGCGVRLGGGSTSALEALEERMVGSIIGEEEDEMEAMMVRLDPGKPFPIGRLDPSAKPWFLASTMATDTDGQPAQRMTAATLDIQLVDDDEDVREGVKEAECCWQFDFGYGLGGDKVGIGTGADSWTDDDTLTSMASEEMLRCRGACTGRHSSLEKHKVGSLVMNSGPPFAVSTVINCDIGDHGHQRAFVLKSDHPCYELRLEDSTTVSASTYND